MKEHLITRTNWARGLTLVEILVAIGIMGISMLLIAAAFPAGVAMSVAVSEETTSQAAFQHALGVLRERYRAQIINDWASHPDRDQFPPLASTHHYQQIPDVYLGPETWSEGVEGWQAGRENRVYQAIPELDSPYSWTGLIQRMGNAGPMGNLFSVVIVVSRRPGTGASSSFVPDFPNDAEDYASTWSDIPELRSVWCDDSNDITRTLDIRPDDSDLLPSNGYIIDSETGQPYLITGVNYKDDGTGVVTVLSEPPVMDPDESRLFWVVPGPYDGSNYGRHSPAVAVFEATLYLP